MKLQKSIAAAPFVAVMILTACVLAACSATGKQTAKEGAFTYEHDPRENPNAMKDIIENPDAIYGFSPSPESDRLKEYADAIDWTNPEQVAEAKAQREEYHASMSELYQMIEDMLADGAGEGAGYQSRNGCMSGAL